MIIPQLDANTANGFLIAYLFDDKNTKLKSSYGTGIKYPSLYEFYKNAGSSSLGAEHGRSYDFGIEKSFPEKGIKFDITYFNHKYEDMIEGLAKH